MENDVQFRKRAIKEDKEEGGKKRGKEKRGIGFMGGYGSKEEEIIKRQLGNKEIKER